MERITRCYACEHENLAFYIQTAAMMHPSNEKFSFDKCANCGLIMLNPRIESENLEKYYTDWYLPYRGAAAWGKYGFLVASDQKKVDARRIEFTLQFASLSATTHVVDLGCGKPTFLHSLQKKTHCQATGIDFSDSGWLLSKNLYDDLELHVGEVEIIKELPSIDVLTMWHYLEHDYHPSKTLEIIHQNSNPHCTLIIEVPNHDSKGQKKYKNYWAGYHTPRHTALYNPHNISLLLENNGWKVREVLNYGSLDPYTLDWMSEMEKQQIDWSKNMETEFWNYVKGKAIAFSRLREKMQSLGFMTVIATKV